MADIKLAERTHPLYDDNIDRWLLYRDAVKGGEDFINDDNLFTHRLEDEEDFQERLDRAYYLNYCDVVPSLYNAYIFKERIERPSDENLILFRANVDRRGTSISDYIAKTGFFSKIFGVMHVLVDMPVKTKDKPTKTDAKAANLNPYCTLIYPSQLVDWSLDADGNFRWVVIKSTYYEDFDPNKERDVQEHYKLITLKDWRIEDDSGLPVKFEDGRPNKGKNELGIIPMATIYNKDIDDDKVGESMIKDIVYINRAILNWCSCIDEQIERQTFSQLIIPDDGSLAEQKEGGDDPLRRVSTSSAWTFNADAKHPPAFISPNTENISVVWKLVVDHVKEIFRLGGLVGTTEDMYAGTSGRSKQIGFLSVNSILAETASRYQKLENDISKLAYMFLGKNSEEFEDTKYPNSFDVEALENEIDTFFKIMERNFSTTLNKTIMKNIARKAVPLATPVVRSDIEKEIESGDGVFQPLMMKEEGNSYDGNKNDGNPNSNLGKSFKTKSQRDKEESSHETEE